MKFFDLKRQINFQKKKILFNINKVVANSNFIFGKEVKDLELKLAKYVGTKYCISVANGSDALLISLMAIGLKKNDEVILPSFSYISSAEAVLRLGAKPVFADVSYKTANIDENLIERHITKRTKVIIPTSLFGQMSNLESINKIAKKNNIMVIEDGAQSFGSQFKNKKSCSMTDLAITSFFPTKILSCFGDGGAIFTNNKKFYLEILKMRRHGQEKKYFHDIIGMNSRLDTIQASILLVKLESLKKEIDLRKNIFRNYIKEFKILEKHQKISFFYEKKFYKSVFSSFNILVKNRDKLTKYLSKKKIPYNIYYPIIIPKQLPYKKFYTKKSTLNADLISKSIVSLPAFPYMYKKEQKLIIRSIKNFFNEI